MNVEELKAEATSSRRMIVLRSRSGSSGTRTFAELRHAALVREIEVGLDELDRGECVECKGDVELRGFFDGVKARGRELLNAR